jgi:hypothetical protein
MAGELLQLCGRSCSFFGATKGPVGSVLTTSGRSVGTRHVKLSTCLPIDLTWDINGYHDLSASVPFKYSTCCPAAILLQSLILYQFVMRTT